MKIHTIATVSFLLAVAFASEAFAAEPVQLQPVLVEFGNPGQVLLNSTGTNKFIAPLAEPRVFATREEYLWFLHDEFNAVLQFDLDGKPIGHTLTVTAIGSGLTFNPDTKVFEPVVDVYSELLAGRFGFLLVQGSQICVGNKLCPRDIPPTSIHIPGVDIQIEPFLDRTTRDNTPTQLGDHDYTWIYEAWTKIIDPPFDELIKRWGNPCEGCVDWDGYRHCQTVQCPGETVPVILSIDLAAENFREQLYDLWPKKYAYGEDIVKETHEADGGDLENGLMKANSEHGAEAPGYRPHVEYSTKYFDCDVCNPNP